MVMVLFDLGETLESDGVLRAGALEVLQELADLRRDGRPAAVLGLLSDTRTPAGPDDLAAIVAEYRALLDELGIRRFFQPFSRRVTLSAQVGVGKPAAAAFRAAVARADPTLGFADVVFVTENPDHVRAARVLGMTAVHVRPAGSPGAGGAELPAVLPVVRDLLAAASDDVPVLGGDRALASVGAPAGERLFLVVQNGRLFQVDHPEVPVLLDTGRHLVVDLEPEVAQELEDSGGACWTLRPLPVGPVVTTPAASGRGPETEAVRRCVDQLSRDRFAADLATLAGHATRHSASADFDAAATWAAAQLAEAGFAVTTQPVPRVGGRCRNVIADRPGTGPAPRDVVLVTAHLDSVNLRGPEAPAPGADDNASGSAGVLAIARALDGAETELDLRLVLFGGEEQGLFGSSHHVAGLTGAERARIRAVVNMDMIAGLNTAVRGVLLEGAAVSRTVLDALAEAAATYTGLAVSIGLSPANSDHVPFIDVGVPAVLTIEGADGTNRRVHTERDTVAELDLDLAMEILRMNVAFVAGALVPASVGAGSRELVTPR